MPAQAQMVRWGNSLAVRIPKSVAVEANLHEGDKLTLLVEARGSVALKSIDRPQTLEELVARITPQNLHGEESWGDAVGAEAW
jgi:antitoxin MazE